MIGKFYLVNAQTARIPEQKPVSAPIGKFYLPTGHVDISDPVVLFTK